MRIVCVYTTQYEESVRVANRCVNSAKEFNYDVELYPSVFWKDMDSVHKKYNLKKKYKPTVGSSTHTKTTCPAFRMANGTTHYLIYKWSIENQKSVCITEHDSIFVGEIPRAKVNGVIQISSHFDKQAGKDEIHRCHRANKMRKYQPDFKFIWDDTKEIIKHPLTGMNGTSGYIIHPGAAKKMIEYIERDGIANADRIRTQWIGEGNLYLQVPQSVLCYHDVKSARLG